MEIAKEDKVKCFDFLSEFEKTIKPNFGSYNINDDHLSRFLNENKIFLGKTNKADRAKALKSRYYIVFEQTKPCGKDNDVVHHLLRHIRNAIAHGHIIKKGNNKFYIEDMKETGIMTMEGNIAKNLLAELKNRLKISIFLWRKKLCISLIFSNFVVSNYKVIYFTLCTTCMQIS